MWRRRLASLGWNSESAVSRGARLLRDNLSPAQLTAYRQSGSFDVVGGSLLGPDRFARTPTRSRWRSSILLVAFPFIQPRPTSFRKLRFFIYERVADDCRHDHQ